jgi:molecular chaperone GrpE (heat shock protein)
MKILERGAMQALLISVGIFLLIVVICYLPKYDVTPPEIALLIANVLLTFVVAFISIAIPLAITNAKKEEEENKTLNRLYINMIEFLIPELLANLDSLEQLHEGMNKEYSSIISDLTSSQKLKQKMGIIQATTKVLKETLSDKVYIATISNDNFLRRPEDSINNALIAAYRDMQFCKQKLSVIDSFFELVLHPTGKAVETVADRMMVENVPNAIAEANNTLKLAIESVEMCINKLIKVLNKYGKSYEIEITLPNSSLNPTSN